MLRSAVIGLGDIGPVHVKAIKGLPGAQLAAVCDIDQALRPQDTKLPFFTDYREMLEPSILTASISVCPTIFIIQQLWMPPGQAAMYSQKSPWR